MGGLRRYELLLLALGLGTLIALLLRAGVTHAVTAEAAAADLVLGVVLWRTCGLTSPLSQKVRLAGAFLFVLWFYSAIARLTPALGTSLRDADLRAVDDSLLGTTPAILCQRFTTPWLTDLLSACYLSYHVYLSVAFLHALWLPVAFGGRFGAALFPAYAFGLLGYLLVPAVGPAKAYAEAFTVPLSGGFLTWLNATIVAQGSSVYDVFPSLHVLVTCVLLNHDWRFVRRRFQIMVLPALGLLFSTIYLRYHYAVDLAAGFALFAALRWTSPRRAKE
jgi:hypothetical protein